MHTLRRLVIVALPPLILAALGASHPHSLENSTADYWRTLHVLLLPVFPLLGIAPWLVARRLGPWAATVAAALGYLYAVCYTALDVLAGIGAGSLQRAGFADAKRVLYDIANALALPGVLAYLAAAVLVSLLVVWRSFRSGARMGAPAASASTSRALALTLALTGALLTVAGAYSFLDSHVYPPRGVLTMFALAVGWSLLLIASGREVPARDGGRLSGGGTAAP